MTAIPDDIYFSGQYEKVMGTGALAKQWSRIHRNMERPYIDSTFRKILELGAGQSQHLRFVKSGWLEYHETDIRIELLNSTKNQIGRKVIKSKQDIQNIGFPDKTFDRIIVSCVLAHVANPLQALNEIKRVATDNSKITIYLPCEPGLLLRAARAVFTIPKNRKLGIQDPYIHHFLEHKNYFVALEHFIKHVFQDNKISSKYYPFRFFGWNLNLYKIYQISI